MTKMDLKAIDAMINSINTRGKKLRNDCHDCLIAVIEHHKEHGDYTRLPKLIDAVKNSLGSSLSAAMIDWVHRFYDGLRFDKDAGKSEMGYFIHVKTGIDISDITSEMKIRFKSSDNEAYFVGNATDFPFYELEKEVAQKPFVLKDKLFMLIKQAETAIEKNVKDHAHNVVNYQQIAVLKNLAESIDKIQPEETALEEITEESVQAVIAA